jgi:hypothetical protein
MNFPSVNGWLGFFAVLALAPGGKSAPAATAPAKPSFLSPPLITQIYTADPAAHVFNGRRRAAAPLKSGGEEMGAAGHKDRWGLLWRIAPTRLTEF